jgi:hypothetical protein
VEFFVRRNPISLPQKTVREVVKELIDIKTKGGCSEVHLKDLTSRLGRFADAFEIPIGQVTGALIEEHLNRLGQKQDLPG